MKKDEAMKVMTSNDKKTIGTVKLCQSQIKRSTFVGAFTVQTLTEFVNLLAASHEPDVAIDIHTIYSESGRAYILLASDYPEEMIRTAAVGCESGVDGNG